MPIGLGQLRMMHEERSADDDENADDRELDEDDGGVDVGRFFDANDQDCGDDAMAEKATRLATRLACGRETSVNADVVRHT